MLLLGKNFGVLLPVFDSLVATQVAKISQKSMDKNILNSNQGLTSISQVLQLFLSSEFGKSS